MITVFTPSFADEANTNAQNLTVKEVVSRLPPDQFRVILLGDGAPDPRISARKNTKILRAYRHGNTARWLACLLTSKVDVYFFPREGPLDSSFLFFRRALGLPIALVTYIVMALDDAPAGAVMARSIREADCVIGNSRYVSQTVQDRFQVETGTVYDGVDFQLFHPPVAGRNGKSRLTVLYVGSFQTRKRVDLIIREAAKWPAVDFRLVGKGEEEKRYRAVANQLDCRNVTFAGHLSQRGVADEMRKADVFLFPSIQEGHPQVLGQAASCGLPTIAMNKYRPDYVVHGETGYLVESDGELSQKLGLLLEDKNLRLQMSAAAARHIVQFNWDRITEDWAKVFAQAVDKRHRD